jgi:uncharacterized protein with FMN-binding domain
MRRSTAAAVGTLTGAALIVGVRLSVTPPAAPAALPPVHAAGNNTPAPSRPATGSKRSAAPRRGLEEGGLKDGGLKDGGLKDGVFKGDGARNQYGTVQVSVRIEDGRITEAAAVYPTTGNSATINPRAVAKLRQETLQAQSAEVSAVSGATYTSESYGRSLQSALDAAKA